MGDSFTILHERVEKEGNVAKAESAFGEMLQGCGVS